MKDSLSTSTNGTVGGTYSARAAERPAFPHPNSTIAVFSPSTLRINRKVTKRRKFNFSQFYLITNKTSEKLKVCIKRGRESGKQMRKDQKTSSCRRRKQKGMGREEEGWGISRTMICNCRIQKFVSLHCRNYARLLQNMTHTISGQI